VVPRLLLGEENGLEVESFPPGNGIGDEYLAETAKNLSADRA